MGQEFFQSQEINLSNEIIIYSDHTQNDFNKGVTDSKSVTGKSSSSGSVSASAGSMSGAIAGVIPAIASVVLLVVTIVTVILTAPIVSMSDFAVSHSSIEFLVEAEKSDMPYLITLFNENESYGYELIGVSEVVRFAGLSANTRYQLTVENDYGAGSNVIKQYEITTAGEPIIPDGKLKILHHIIDYETQTLSINLEIDDLQSLLYDFRMSVSDDAHTVELIKDSLADFEELSLEGLSRGYLTVEICAKTRHPSGNGQEKILTIYKVYY